MGAGSWPPVLVHMLRGIPFVVQGLDNVLLLLVSVRHKCANPVSLGHQEPCHSNLVCKVVVRGEIQVAACVVYFVYTDVDRDPSSWWVTRKESYPFDSSMVNLIVVQPCCDGPGTDRLGLLVEL